MGLGIWRFEGELTRLGRGLLGGMMGTGALVTGALVWAAVEHYADEGKVD